MIFILEGTLDTWSSINDICFENLFSFLKTLLVFRVGKGASLVCSSTGDLLVSSIWTGATSLIFTLFCFYIRD